METAVTLYNFQARVHEWMLRCFTRAIATDQAERNHRFFEEASELVQSMGMSRHEAHQLVDYVWSRPAGVPEQEMGGVLVTAAALGNAGEIDMMASAELELLRINNPAVIEKIRAKQAAKPKISALPIGGEFHKLDNDKQVFFYEQDFYVLSNFSAFSLTMHGLVFPTSEHAYHWHKFRHPTGQGWVQQQVQFARSAHDAFKIAEQHQDRVRQDWRDVRVNIMRDILRAKADQHEYVRRKLLATGDRELIEDSWRDDFWGWGPNRDGQNMLGKLWMEVREALRAKASVA